MFSRRIYALLLVSVLLSACGALPTQVDRPFSPARQASPDSPLVRIAQDSSPAPTLTGFRLLPDGFYSLDARIQPARRGQRLTRRPVLPDPGRSQRPPADAQLARRRIARLASAVAGR